MKKLIALLLVLVFITALIGCGKDEPLPEVTNPKKAILGKWEIIEDSFGPIRYPGSYTEYRKDSVLFDYVSEDDFTYSTYWLVESDSLLYKSHVYIDQGSGDTILVDVQFYKYRFLNYNKLRLDLLAPALSTKLILRRIKQLMMRS